MLKPVLLTSYASTAVHGSIGKALDLAGLGSDSLRLIAVDAQGHMDVTLLAERIEQDRDAGYTPFLVVGSAGTVDTGAIDDLDGLADLCVQQGLWFHVDGALGALGMLAPSLAPRLKGMERADSLAFDFHKWAQIPYDAGFLLVRDGQLQQDAFAASSNYLPAEFVDWLRVHPGRAILVPSSPAASVRLRSGWHSRCTEQTRSVQ